MLIEIGFVLHDSLIATKARSHKDWLSIGFVFLAAPGHKNLHKSFLLLMLRQFGLSENWLCLASLALTAETAEMISVAFAHSSISSTNTLFLSELGALGGETQIGFVFRN